MNILKRFSCYAAFSLSLLVPLPFSGCVTTTPAPVELSAQTSEQILVTAQKTTAIAKDVFDTFLKIEYENKEALMKVSPEIHNYAEVIRRNGINWLKTARALTKTYQNNRTPENRASLTTAIQTLLEGISQSNQYITKSAKGS